MDERVIQRRPGVLRPDNPWRLNFLYDFCEPWGGRKLIGPGRGGAIVNSAWAMRPIGGIGLGLQAVANSTTDNSIQLGFRASQIGWSSGTRPRSLLCVGYAKHGDNFSSILSLGNAGGTGYFQFGRFGWYSGRVSYYGAPDYTYDIKPDGVDSIWSLAYTYDGAGNHYTTVCDRDRTGVLRGWYESSITGYGSNQAVGETVAARIGVRPDGGEGWAGGGGNALYMLGGAPVAWSAAQRRALVVQPWASLLLPARTARRWTPPVDVPLPTLGPSHLQDLTATTVRPGVYVADAAAGTLRAAVYPATNADPTTYQILVLGSDGDSEPLLALDAVTAPTTSGTFAWPNVLTDLEPGTALRLAWVWTNGVDVSEPYYESFSTLSAVATRMEAVAAGSLQSASYIQAVSMAEAVASSDSHTAAATVLASRVETVAGTDLAAASAIALAAAVEAVATADATSASAVLAAAIAEATAAADLAQAAATVAASAMEPAATADLVASGAIASASLLEAVAATDAAIALATLVATLREDATAAELASAVQIAVTAVTDAVLGSDTATTGVLYVATRTEAAATTDALTAAATLVAQLTEAGSTSDQATAAAQLVALITEQAVAADSSYGAVPATYSVSITELAQALDLVVGALLGVPTFVLTPGREIWALPRVMEISARPRTLEIRA